MSSTIVRLRSTSLVVALTAGVAILPGVALAEAPTQQGWWAASSAAVPGLPAGTTAPDVPKDGLLVEGTASSPTAYAALSYVLAPGVVPEALVLTVAEKSATTPGQTLILHPLESPQFEPVQGGALSKAPAYDRKRSVKAKVDASGTTFTFDDLAPLELTVGLAVAVLPDADGGRVVLRVPDEASLTTSGGSAGATSLPTVAPPPSDGSGSGSDSGSAAGSASGGFVDGFSSPGSSSSDFLSSLEPAAALPPGSELPAVAAEPLVEAALPEQAPVTSEFVQVAAQTDASGGGVQRFLGGLIVLAAAVATLLWAFAGRSDPDAPVLSA